MDEKFEGKFIPGPGLPQKQPWMSPERQRLCDEIQYLHENLNKMAVERIHEGRPLCDEELFEADRKLTLAMEEWEKGL